MLVLVGLGLFSMVAAAAKKCDMGHVVRCICPASMSVTCADGSFGYVNNDEIPTKVFMSVTNKTTGQVRTIELNNTDVGGRDYYASTNSLLENAAIAQQIQAAGISSTDAQNLDFNLQSFEFKDSLVLIQDPNAPAPTAPAQPTTSNSEYNCLWENDPTITKDSSCGGKGICSGAANCTKKDSGRGAEPYLLFCRPISNIACPSANDCLLDSDTSISATADKGANEVEYKRSSRASGVTGG